MRIARYFALLLLVVIACSCGGGGGINGLGGGSNLVATYKSDFTRGIVANNSSLILYIDQHGNVGAQISNASGTEWAGQGTISGSSLNVSLVAVSSSVSGTVLCQGNVVIGSPPTLSITLSGAFSATMTATRFASSGVLPYAGSYNLTTAGDESGTGSLTISETGDVTGSLNSPTFGNNIALQGTVDLDGHIHFLASAFSVSGTFDGYVFLPPGATLYGANGNWSINTANGTWSAQKLATP